MPDDTFVIEEDIPNGLSVTLQGSDLPHALPRSFAAFNSGGEVGMEVVRLEGRKRPIFQVHQAQERPLKIRGAFRDHLVVRDGGDPNVLHARAMRDALERIRNRANDVRISWGSESRIGLLKEADYGEESKHDITYELTFEISVGVDDARETNTGGRRTAPQTADLVGQLRAIVAERRAQLESLRTRNMVASVISTVAAVLDVVDVGLAAVENEAAALDTAAVGNVSRAASRLYTTAQSTQAVLVTAQATLAPIIPADVVVGSNADALSSWTAFQAETFDVMLAMAIEVQRLRAEARSRMQRAVRLYRVRPGDTLETIARSELGDASRAGDLGLSPHDLVPGALIRIPEAA